MGFDPRTALVEGARSQVRGGSADHHRGVVDVGDGLDIRLDGWTESVWHDSRQ